MVAVPLLLSTNDMPGGNEPVSVNCGVGTPVVVNEYAPGAPTVSVADVGPEIVGAVDVTSTEPMSQKSPEGLLEPRWSSEPAAHNVTAAAVTASVMPVAVESGILLIAGLLLAGSLVWVGPPLVVSGASAGAAITSFLGGPAVNPQEVSPGSASL